MLFVTQPPPERLRTAIAELWFLEDDGKMSAGLPKPYVELVVSLSGVHWWRAAPGAREYRYLEAWVTPLQQGPRFARAVGSRRLIGARLEPWVAATLFGTLPRGDGTPPPHLAKLIGRSARLLRHQLLKAQDLSARFDCLGNWLDERIFPDCLTSNAATAKASARTLRRHFAREVGLSPKQWRLLHRLDSVLRDPSLADQNRPLAQLAHEHGYADQPHFNREISRLTGTTPGELRRRPAGCPPHLVRRV